MNRLILCLLMSGLALAAPSKEAWGKMPVSFESNQGQADPQVKFLSRGRGYALFLTPAEAVMSLAGPLGGRPDVLRMRLVGANPAADPKGVQELKAKSGYFIGNDPKKWRADIPHFARVEYREVVPGMDLVFHGEQDRLEYDVVVRPGADPKSATLEFRGAERIEIDERGALVLHLARGKLLQHKPVVYQEENGVRKSIPGRYVLKGRNRVGFKVASYDRGKPLVIDPTLSYSTYIGGGDSEVLNAHPVVIDSSGAVYLVGSTSSADFPTQNGFQGDPGVSSNSDLFIAKLDPSQTGSAQLVYATYLGGNKEDGVASIAVGPAGSLYITGLTKSTDFPTKNAFQGSLSGIGGFNEVIFTKLDPTQSGTNQLIYSTYLGGDDDDRGAAIAVDASGIAYLAGKAGSANFPTRNPFQGTFLNNEAFVAKIDPSQSGDASLLYATLLGGSDNDDAGDVAVDASGRIYVTGITASNDFPLRNQFQSFPSGPNNAFVSVLDPSESGSGQLIYSTYFGGATEDEGGNAIALDPSGKIYVAGDTRSSDLPVRNAFQPSLQGAGDVFVAKFDPSQSGDASLLYATYLGGSGGTVEEGLDIAVDRLGRAYVSGLTDAADFPTRNAVDPDLSGAEDAFLAKLDPTQSGDASLLFSTYLGGSGNDEGSGVAVDADCRVTLGGSTFSGNFPTQNPFQASLNGSVDAFVSRILFDRPAITSPLTAEGAVGTAFSYTVTADGATPMTFAAEGLPAGLSLSEAEVSGTPTTAGIANVTLTAINGDCDDSETLVMTIEEGVETTGGGGNGSGGTDGGGCNLLRLERREGVR